MRVLGGSRSPLRCRQPPSPFRVYSPWLASRFMDTETRMEWAALTDAQLGCNTILLRSVHDSNKNGLKSRACCEVLADHGALLARQAISDGRYSLRMFFCSFITGTAYHSVSHVQLCQFKGTELLMVYVASTLLISVLINYLYA